MSKVNLELKYFCDDFKPIREVLKQTGAIYQTTKSQKDHFLNLPEGKGKSSPRLKLRYEKDTKELVYYERPDFNETEGAQAKIKIYTPRDEEIHDFLTTALGEKAIVEKTRVVWVKDISVFHLDEVI